MVTTPGAGGTVGPHAEGSVARSYLDALEHALRGIEAAGEALAAAPRSAFDLRPAARALERAAAALLDAYDVRREVGSALDEAAAASDEALAAVSGAFESDPGLRPAAEWITRASAWLRSAVDGAARSSRAMVPPRDVVASVETPALHAIARRTIPPQYVVTDPAPPIDPPEPPLDPALPVRDRLALVRERAAAKRDASAARREIAKDARDRDRSQPKRALDAPRPGFVAGRHVSAHRDEVVKNRARECFEEVSALGVMRVPLLGDPWRTTAVLDRRMLTSIDAIAAMGSLALEGLERFVVDSPAKDPSRAFGLAMVAGCFEGRDALAVVERGLRFLGLENREVIHRAAEALALVPHPELVPLLRRWLAAEEAGLRALAIDVLARRGQATPEELERALLDEALWVVEKALVPAALARVEKLASRTEELSLQTDEAIAPPLAWAIVLGDVPFASTRLGEWLGSAREDAALLPFAIAADHDDAMRVVELADKRAKRARLETLGWLGAAEGLPILVRTLEQAKDDELKLAAAFGLDRITGARLYEDAFVAPDDLDVAEPDEPELPSSGEPLARDRRVGDPRDLPAEGSRDRTSLPTVDASRWKAWLAPRQDAFAAGKRYRRGRPYSPAITLEELDREAIVTFERRVLHRELVVKTGQALAFDPHAFVSVQELQLAAWAEPAQRASSQPGAFGRSRRR